MYICNLSHASALTWLRHQWKHFPRYWPFVRGEFPAQRPVTRSIDVFFDLRLNKRLSKQSWGWWFETLSCPLWRHCNEMVAGYCCTLWRTADILILSTISRMMSVSMLSVGMLFTRNIAGPTLVGLILLCIIKHVVYHNSSSFHLYSILGSIILQEQDIQYWTTIKHPYSNI